MTETDLYTRLAAARADFNAMADFKKVKSEGLRFAYLPVEVAKPVIEECTSKHGITILPKDYETVDETVEDRDNGYGKKTAWRYIKAVIPFMIACPEGCIELRIMAEAQDNSDKCVNKVYTMAYKNLIKIVFGFSESAKDDSKFDDARQQDNDFNQAETIVRPRQTKQAPIDDPIFGKGKGAKL